MSHKKTRRPKPKALLYEWEDQKGDKHTKKLAEVYENIYKDLNERPGNDLCADRDAEIWGHSIFDGMTNAEQAQAAFRMSRWFFRYARWIASRPDGKV